MVPIIYFQMSTTSLPLAYSVPATDYLLKTHLGLLPSQDAGSVLCFFSRQLNDLFL